MRFVDPTGMDYWSTNNQDEIKRFLESMRETPQNRGSIIETFDMSSWAHATDAEFTGNLTFNDETNKFYSSYGYVDSDGTPTIVGVSIEALGISDGKAWIDGPGMRWTQKASGRIENTYPESIFIGSWAHVGERILHYLWDEMFDSPNSINGSLGFKHHRKGKNWQKHSNPRSGGDPEVGRYGRTKNDKKGTSNKKYIPPKNPNKRK